METERWQRIESIYDAALDLDPGSRAEFVQQSCGEDEPLRQEVLSLLAESDRPIPGKRTRATAVHVRS